MVMKIFIWVNECVPVSNTYSVQIKIYIMNFRCTKIETKNIDIIYLEFLKWLEMNNQEINEIYYIRSQFLPHCKIS